MAIHSKYKPQTEADKFVAAISCTSDPDYIIIVEPGESYLAKSFRKRFPLTKLIAVRYTNDLFTEKDILWDWVYRPAMGSLSFFLLNIISDEFFANTLFLSWKPSTIEWPENATQTHKQVNATIRLFKSIAYTRTAFGYTWLKNIFTNLLYSKNICSIQFPNEDFLFLAAGYSLEQNFDLLSKSKISKLCAASAYDAVAYHDIHVDACISSDGTYWAAEQLKNIKNDIPVLFPLEARIAKELLNKNQLGFLSYGSALEEYLFTELSLPYLKAKRNGTVSGTAIELLLEQTNKNIYCFGLDLACGKSFSHARPHKSLKKLVHSSNKFLTLEELLLKQRVTSESLHTYASWFNSLKIEKTKRIFRVGIGKSSAKLKNISSISADTFSTKYANNMHKDINFTKPEKLNFLDKKAFLQDFLQNIRLTFSEIDLNDSIYGKSDDKKLLILKELLEFTAYNRLIAYIKEKSPKNEKQLREKVEMELQKLIFDLF